MIGKILPHRENFGPLSSYLLTGRDRQNPERVEWVAMRNLDGVEPDHAYVVMEATAKQSRRVKKPRQHVIVSWAHGDQPDDEQMLAIMDQTLADLGLKEHQAMYVAHNDTQHAHVHAIVNRVHPETQKAARDSHERLTLRRSLMRQEQQYGLEQTPMISRGRHDRQLFSEIELAQREDRDALMRYSRERCVRLREELAYSFKAANGWSSLDGMLERRGYNLVQSGRGVRISRGLHYAKLSDVLPPKLSTKRLTEKWGRFSEYWKKQQRKVQRPQKRKRRQRDQQKAFQER